MRNKSSIRKWLLPLLLMMSLESGATNIVRIVPPQSEQDASHSYFSELLQLALDKTQTIYGQAVVQPVSFVLEQGRAEKALGSGQHIDVYWMGTSLKREQQLTPIRIPLLKGLLGYRGLIIRESDRSSFTHKTNWLSLTRSTICQGMHWPDSDILEHSGFRVIRSARFKSMFAMLENNRCDMFPRGIHEGPAEVSANRQTSSKLGWFDKYLIYYPFPMYFFTQKDNLILASRITQGLEMMISDGSFTLFMQQHPVSRHLFPLSQWTHRVMLDLINPDLPLYTDITNKRYWVVPD